MTEQNDTLIVSGVHLELTDALKSAVAEKVDKLFRHETHIIRIRIELEFHAHNSKENEFVAKGHIEINGPPKFASVATDDLYKSIDQLVIKLDRMLRRRSRLRQVKRKHPHGVEIPSELPKVRDGSALSF